MHIQFGFDHRPVRSRKSCKKLSSVNQKLFSALLRNNLVKYLNCSELKETLFPL